MTKRNRASLKDNFREGGRPCARDFADLIDSQLNIQDDGIEYTEHDGLRLTQIHEHGRVLSLFAAVEQTGSVWTVGLGGQGKRFSLGVAPRGAARARDNDGGGSAVLTLLTEPGQPGARVGINQPNPRHELEVDGTLACSGRIGAPGTMTAPADGNWHNITGPLVGCTALEVVAGAGNQGSAKFSLLHAVAMKTFGAKGEITASQAHLDNRRSRLQLRWEALPGKGVDVYQLQIRVGCSYGDNVWIRYHVTRLWFDPLMTDCASAQGSAPAAKGSQ